MDMQYCPAQDTLYALHGPEEYVPFANTDRAYLQKWDAVSGEALAGASEFMEDWNLTCFCVTDQDSGGSEVIAGAVSGKVAVGQHGGLAVTCQFLSRVVLRSVSQML